MSTEKKVIKFPYPEELFFILSEKYAENAKNDEETIQYRRNFVLEKLLKNGKFHFSLNDNVDVGLLLIAKELKDMGYNVYFSDWNSVVISII